MSIKIENCTKRYGEQVAINNISFNVASGEIVGFLGPNGAGKSTLMKIITGFLAADSGNVSVCGMEASPEQTAFRSKIGYLPENNPLYHDMYVKEYLAFVAGIYSISNSAFRVAETIEMTGLTTESHKKIGALSKGYRQRVGIAQALVHNPDVLILDEPTTGLDPNQLEEIRLLIKTISRDKTVMLSTHIMQEVEAVCSRVLIINKGSVVADASTDEVKKLSKGMGQQVYIEFASKVEKSDVLLLPFIQNVDVLDENQLLITAIDKTDIRKNLFIWAVENKHIILTLKEQTHSLESVFQKITGEQ